MALNNLLGEFAQNAICCKKSLNLEYFRHIAIYRKAMEFEGLMSKFQVQTLPLFSILEAIGTGAMSHK